MMGELLIWAFVLCGTPLLLAVLHLAWERWRDPIRYRDLADQIAMASVAPSGRDRERHSGRRRPGSRKRADRERRSSFGWRPRRPATRLVDSPKPPVRLPLGADTVARIRSKNQSVQAELNEWLSVPVSTGHYDERAK
jgi:hypothetical protein